MCTVSSQTKEGSYAFPLYLYPGAGTPPTLTFGASPGPLGRTPNLSPGIVQRIAEKIGVAFTPEKEPGGEAFAPIDLLDYIYAVLHSPAYREKYKEFLKIDFPRIPYPRDGATFWQLVHLGAELRQLHLLESPALEHPLTQYPASGDNVVVKPRHVPSAAGEAAGSVYINDTQHFANVPQPAWEFYIGGYQPAQKWLKDRKGRPLDYDDIRHYQKIIAALTETHRLMQEIDQAGIE